MKRGFQGIWIPKEIWLNEDLSAMEKLFWAEIKSLDNEDGCYASNKYFEDFFQLKTTRVSQIINSLKKKGYINIQNERKNNKIIQRVITIKCKAPCHKSERPPTAKVKDPLPQKCKGITKRDNIVDNKDYKPESTKPPEDILPPVWINMTRVFYTDLININNPTRLKKMKINNLPKNWTNPIRLLHERDEISYEEMREVWLWAFNDPFWKANILSPSKFREKYDTLYMQMNRKNGNKIHFDRKKSEMEVAQIFNEKQEVCNVRNKVPTRRCN